MDELNQLQKAILEGNFQATEDSVNRALAEGIPLENILKDGLILAMGEVGRLFEEGEFFVPEMLVSARAMQSGLKILKPHLSTSDIVPSGKVILGTVKGDLHDIGKNLVSMMLEGAGFEIIDLGTDVTPERFLEAVKEHHPQIVGMSALLTTTIPQMSRTIQALDQAGVRETVKVIVGGAPVTEDFAKKIGADGYGADASSAVRVAKSLVSN